MGDLTRRELLARAGVLAVGTTAAVGTDAASSRPSAGRPLAGIGVGIDPGHNGRNWADPTYIDRPIWNGHNVESCDTTGTATDAGYPEALFNWNVAVALRTRLEALGARVVLTRHSNAGVGPCVTTRAHILDRARLDVAVDIHADGGPPAGRGFSLLVPVRDAENKHVVNASIRLARRLRSAFVNETPMPISDYYGVDGIEARDDLAGLNLTTVPKVLIECGNMRNKTDAALLVTPRFQRLVAKALEVGIRNFLVGEHLVR
jgi:N-acetylmuramoyl-L-alanine amidase